MGSYLYDWKFVADVLPDAALEGDEPARLPLERLVKLERQQLAAKSIVLDIHSPFAVGLN